MSRVALVTGASRGIGLSSALALAESGCDVVINFYPGLEAEAQEAVESIKAMGRDAIAISGDVSKAEDVERFITEAQAWKGSLDVLVNNAGITRDGLVIRMNEEDWDRVLDTNLKGMFLVSKAAAKIMMRQRRGWIVNVSSVVGVMGNAGQANYAASKAGAIGLTKALAKELASRNILVNAVAPGFIDSDMTRGLSEEVKEKMLAQVPLGRLGSAQDVAQTVVFLATTAYITGQVLPIDGGMRM